MNALSYLRGAVRSWTIWANGVLLAAVTAAPELSTALPQLQPYLQESVFKRLTFIVLILNLALRVKTHQSLADKSGNTSK